MKKVKKVKKVKLPQIGVPVRLDDKAIQRVPKPKPSRAQILEALVTLKIEQVQAARLEWDKETERMLGVASTALNGDLGMMAFSKFKVNMPGLSYDGKTLNNLSLVLDGEELTGPTKQKIKAWASRENSDDKPSIQGASRYCDEQEVRRVVRKQISQQLQKQEGTNKDRLTTMLGDATFRAAMENTLAKIEGKTVVEA